MKFSSAVLELNSREVTINRVSLRGAHSICVRVVGDGSLAYKTFSIASVELAEPSLAGWKWIEEVGQAIWSKKRCSPEMAQFNQLLRSFIG